MTTHSHCAWTNEGGHVKTIRARLQTTRLRIIQHPRFTFDMNLSHLPRRITRKSRETWSDTKYQLRRLVNKNKKTNYTRFVIIGTIRSGSTMLTNIINSHPAATCFFEPFHIHQGSIPFEVEGYERISKCAQAVLLRKQQPITFTNEYIWNHWHSSRTKAVGFKLLYTQARLDSWWKSGEFESWWEHCGIPPIYGSESNNLWEYLQEDQTIKIIHLTRINKLKGVLSAKTAIQTSAWGDGASGGFKSSDGLKLHIDPKEVLLTIKGNSRFESIISDSFDPGRTLHITYEKLSEQTEKTLSNIWSFLGIEPFITPPKTRKLRTVRLEESISNSKELRELFPEYFLD